MKISQLDLGGRPVVIVPHGGMGVDTAVIAGDLEIPFAVAGTSVKVDVQFWVEAWQSLGGENALSIGALRYLIAQLEQLRTNRNMQPVFVRFFGTDQPTPMYPSRNDVNDGWYYIESLDVDRESWNLAGALQASATLTRKATTTAPLSILAEGPTMVELSPPQGIWLFGPSALLPAPVGATVPISANDATIFSRVGAEGTIPIVGDFDTAPNPAPIIASATPADLFKGGVKVFDTVTQGGNAIVSDGSAAHNSRWLQILGRQPLLTGDVILVNGLVMLRVNQGGEIEFWAFNTELTPDAWQQVCFIRYRDSSLNTAVVKTIAFQRIRPTSSVLRVMMATSVGHQAEFEIELDSAQRTVGFRMRPRTENNTRGLGLCLVATTAFKIVANATNVVDVATQGTTNLPTTVEQGHTLAIGTTTNQMIFGIFYEGNVPDTGMPLAQSTTELGIGETAQPLRERTIRYGFWAAPFPTSPNLLGEAESGTLGTGWSSQADAGSSGGNAARALSGTVSGNADTWMTATVPKPGNYVPWFRARVASAAGTTAEMTVGIWDNTSSAFQGQMSTTYKAAQLATSYGWLNPIYRTVTDGVTNGTTTVTSATAFFTSADVGKTITGSTIPGGATISSITNTTTVVISAAASSATGVTLEIGIRYFTPTATHSMRIRAVTAATIGTNWFFDQAALIPFFENFQTFGEMPADIFAQWLGRRRLTMLPT
jgi:hypothetical protein